MESRFIPEEITYTGEQLTSHWILRSFRILGDAIVAFIGPANVPVEGMVDQIDRVAGDAIYSPRMLHFIAEHFDTDLERAVLRQRLLVALAAEAVARMAGDWPVRHQDDIFLETRKLSVSIATASAVSTLMHLGLNIETEGVPVEAIGLTELGIDPKHLAETVLAGYADEVRGIRVAKSKVQGVT